MLVIPDMKWEKDKEFYNEIYLRQLKRNWENHHNFCSKRIMEVKREETKEKFRRWRDKAQDNLFKLDYLLSKLPPPQNIWQIGKV